MRPNALLFVALAACSGPRPPAPVAAARAPAPPAPAVVHARGEAAAYERRLDGLAGVGAGRYVAGDLRALLSDGDVTLASDRAPAPIADAVELDGGRWLFVDYGGGVTAADGFLGPLRAVGRVPVGATTSPWSRGRAASVRAGRLWLADGAAVREAEVPGAPVLAAAFASASAGAVVHRDGALSVTDDGGARWQRVELGGDVAVSVRFDGAVLRVATTRGELALTGTTLAPAPAASTPPMTVERSQQEETLRLRVQRALRERSGFSGQSALTLPSGARVSLDEGLLAWTPPRGEPWTGRVGGADCSALAPWGDGFGLLCGRLLRGDARGHLTRVELPPEARDDEETLLSDDGLRAVRPGACPAPRDPDVNDEQRWRESLDPPADAPAPSACVLEGGRWRTVALPASDDWRAWQVVAMHGPSLLLRLGDERAAWQVFDTTTGRGRPVTADASTAVRSLAWLRDGSLVGVGAACAEGAERCDAALLRGAPDAPLRAAPLPAGATRVAFADAARGLAAGATLGEVWRTTNGGVDWEEVPVAEGLRRGAIATFARVACDAGGCQAGPLLRIEGWGPLRADETRVVYVPGEPPEAPDVRVSPAPLTVAPMRCTPLGAAAASPWRLAGGANRVVTPEAMWAFDAAGEGTRVRWAGERGRGEVTTPLLLQPVGLWGGAGRALLLRATAPGLVLAAGGVARELPGPLLPTVEGAQLQADAADVLSDGAGLVMQSATTIDGVVVDVVVTVDASGAAARRFVVRGAERDDHAAFALARRGGRWSPAAISGDGVRVDTPGGAAAVLAGWSGPLAVCAGPAAGDVTTLRVAGCVRQRHCVASALREGVRQEVAEVELAAGGACLRALRFTARGTVGGADDPEGARRTAWNLRAAPDGALVGFSDDGERRARVRCVRQ